MRRLVLAGSAFAALLVAGCGTAARLNFTGHSRPGPAVDVSVYLGTHAILVSPRSVAAGLLTFDVTNQGPHTQYLLIWTRRYRGVLSHRSLPVSAGSTAQLTLPAAPGAYEVGTAAEDPGAPPNSHYITPAALRVTSASKAGNSALLQP